MKVKQGDIISLGDHKLLCGDSTNADDIKLLLDQEEINLLLTDPPYGIGYVESKKELTGNSDHKVITNDQLQSDSEYMEFTKAWLTPCLPYLANKNSYYIFNTDKMLLPLSEAIKESGSKMAQLLIWIKSQPVIGRMDYLPQHEIILYGWHGTHKFYGAKSKSVLFYPKPSRSKLHPTMKPVPLLRHLILNSSKTSEIVFDPFGGSGSTLLACEQTKRQCRMIEMDPDYCSVICKRFTKLTGISPVLLNG